MEGLCLSLSDFTYGFAALPPDTALPWWPLCNNDSFTGETRQEERLAYVFLNK